MASGTPAPHDGVVYRSRGVVLVAGDSANAAEAALELLKRAPKLRISLFAPGVDALTDLPSNITAVGGRVVALRGHLGQFSASVRVAADKVEDAGIFSANADRNFDLVLDLYRVPLLGQGVLPYGYYAPGEDAAALVRALDSLPQLTGNFHKPRYFDFRPQLCAHAAEGITGCTRCLEVCATAAIRSTGDQIKVDPYLCQGCANCALACPTGALGFLQPTPEAVQDLLNRLLADRVLDAGPHILVVHDATVRHLLPVIDGSGVLLFEVSPLAAFSDALWLAALVGGVSGVVLAMAPTTPPQSRKLIEQKAGELRAILAGLGGDPAALHISAPEKVGSVVAKLRRGMRPFAPVIAAKRWPTDPKRGGFLGLVDAFARSRHARGQVSEPCALPTGAGFGTVRVDPGKCTICHVCTDLCPTGAVSHQPEPVPALFFKESLCVQCDLCRAGCPQAAISLQARFLPDAAMRESSRELASESARSIQRLRDQFHRTQQAGGDSGADPGTRWKQAGDLECLQMCQNRR